MEERVPCPTCSAETPLSVFYSVHAARRPDHRAAVLADVLQQATCVACGAAFRAAPQLVYLDPSRGQWLLVAPPAFAARWAGFEEAARELFDQEFGPEAPGPVAEIGRALKPRVVFGWAALREKVLAQDLGIDDAELETLKAVVIAGGEGVALDDAELRLVGADAEGLDLVRLDPASGRHLEALRVPRALLDDVRGEAWATTRLLVAGGWYVDVGRVLLAEVA